MAIAVSGFLFKGLTATPEAVVQGEGAKREPNQHIDVIPVRVFITLSGVARTVDLFSNAGPYRFGQSEAGSYTADDFKIAKDNPVLEFKVDWMDESPIRRFAKVVVEAPGEKTFTHVFDSTGDIDDFVELPF